MATGSRGWLILAVLAAGCRARPPQSEGVVYPEQVATLAERRDEVAVKLERVRALLSRSELAELVVDDAPDVAWLTAGAIPDGPEPPPVALRVPRAGPPIALGREALPELEEDLRNLGYAWRHRSWLESARPPGEPVPAGAVVPGLGAVQSPLLDAELRRYRWLGRNTADAVLEVCRRLEPGMTARGVEQLAAAALTRRSIAPLAIRVVADGRIEAGPYTPPSDRVRVASGLTLRVRARRWGLIAALTRQVRFGTVPGTLDRELRAVACVTAFLWSRTVAGAALGAVVTGAGGAYAAAGYAGAWIARPHGGAVGYRGPEDALPGSSRVVRPPEAIAWSAAVGGAVAEDTILVLDSRWENLTAMPDWPTSDVRAAGRVVRTPTLWVRTR